MREGGRECAQARGLFLAGNPIAPAPRAKVMLWEMGLHLSMG